jgi:DinB family protein
VYLDALEFLDEEREAWAPFEVLASLSDEQLNRPVEAAHGWSGRQLMGHLLGWQDNAMTVAKELAVGETSATKRRSDEDWEARGGEVINAEMDAAWAALPLDELRARFATIPGELRGYLTVVPESRWLKHPDNQAFFSEETTRHYEGHADDLRAILEAVGA